MRHFYISGRTARMETCSIERLCDTAGECWLLTIPAERAGDAALLCTALGMEQLEAIRFADKTHQLSLQCNGTELTLTHREKTVRTDPVWLDAVTALLLRTALHGWDDTAHLDQTFRCGAQTVDVSVFLAPPTQTAP